MAPVEPSMDPEALGERPPELPPERIRAEAPTESPAVEAERAAPRIDEVSD
jgi:hypothetical protein